LPLVGRPVVARTKSCQRRKEEHGVQHAQHSGMSLSTWQTTIEDGSLCIIYEGIDRVQHFVAKKGAILNNRFGAFYHDDLLGRPYGLKWVSRTAGQGGRRRRGPPKESAPKGFVFVLHPTPELWTYALPHRTQIIYTPDISYITLQLDLKPGAVVIETGTGSGSLTCALARTVLPTGHVHTFEYHAERAQRARDDFAMLGLAEVVTVELRDTMANGFPAELQGKADAVFLDLPGPWDTIPSAHTSLKEGGTICGFSPCIEQVQRTCEVLRATGFHEVRTVEVRFTNYESKTMSAKIPDFGPAASGEVAVAAAAEPALAAGGAAASDPEAKASGAAVGEKRRREEEEEPAAGGQKEGGEAAAVAPASGGAAASTLPEMVKIVSSRTLPGMSHSSYLTFAMKVTTAEKITLPSHLLEAAAENAKDHGGARSNESWLRVGETGGGSIGPGSAEEKSVSELLSERDGAKRTKDYGSADAIREKLHGLGVHFNDRQRTWCTKQPDGTNDPGPRPGTAAAAASAGGSATKAASVLNLMVKSSSGAKLVQVESQGAATVATLAERLVDKLGLGLDAAANATLQVKTADGQPLTEGGLEEIRAKGRGQLQVSMVTAPQ
jgi:tRNA (adenine57-N1/adenine58-N1)-methyltransferase